MDPPNTVTGCEIAVEWPEDGAKLAWVAAGGDIVAEAGPQLAAGREGTGEAASRLLFGCFRTVPEIVIRIAAPVSSLRFAGCLALEAGGPVEH